MRLACKKTIAWRGAVAALCLLASWARAGGGPQNVLVVVNAADKASVELGRYYAEKRGIPARNVCRISLPVPQPNIIPVFFEKYIRRPIQAHIEKEKLGRQIDYLVLCWDAPSRVNEIESITAVLYHGFKNAPLPPPCQLQTNTYNTYFRAERAFTHDGIRGATNRWLVTMLTAPTPDEAKRLVDRSVAADGTAPTGTFYLLSNVGDGARNTRFKAGEEFDFHARLWPSFPRRVLVEHHTQMNLPDVMGYQVGIHGYPEFFWKTNTYRPGAIADHLTSFGGRLPKPALGHSSVLDWIGAGASASYGTVNEPCNFPEKFPDPMVFFWYVRGFNLAESYWMSVAHPHQGLFVGDPLMAPYAKPPRVTVSGVTPGQAVSGVVTVEVAAAGAPDRPCAALDYYVDDLFAATVTNITPQGWNEIHAEVDGRFYSYIIGDRDDLFAVVDGLARDIRANNPMMNAVPWGDRLVLMDGRIGKPGTSTAYRVWVEEGLGPKPTVTAWTLTPTFLDSVYPARKYLPLRGVANEGDAVESLVTLADGVTVTVRVEAAKGEAATSIVSRLFREINGHPVLKTEQGVKLTHLKKSGDQVEFAMEAVKPGPQGMAIVLKYRILPASPGSGLGPPATYEGRLGDTVDLLCSRAAIRFACGREELRARVALDTTTWADGPHTIRFVARDGTAVQTQGFYLLPLEVQNGRAGGAGKPSRGP